MQQNDSLADGSRPGRLPNFADNTWVGSAAVVHDGGEDRMYLTFVCPNTQTLALNIFLSVNLPVHVCNTCG